MCTAQCENSTTSLRHFIYIENKRQGLFVFFSERKEIFRPSYAINIPKANEFSFYFSQYTDRKAYIY